MNAILRRRDVLRRSALAAAAPWTLALAACGGGSSPAAATVPTPAGRTWRVGFAGTPPRADVATMLQGVALWSKRAEIAAIHEELPWSDLLSGMSAEAVITRDKLQLVQHYRSLGLQIYFMGELNDGLDRARECSQLRARGRSITEAPVQAMYIDYMLAVARMLKPDYIGLAAETNLVRALAPTPLYAAVVKTANACADALRAGGVGSPLLSTVQVEAAWGKLGTSGSYVGIDTDRADFAFSQRLGLSSYPYFAFAQPEDMPADYYSRLRGTSPLGVMVTEGGWTSAAVGTIVSNADKQARYIRRHAALLDSVQAQAWLQLLYADLDLNAWPKPHPENLPLFAGIGLTDTNFVGKPALTEWDALFARRRTA